MRRRFVEAHGYEAGPTQRPRLAGAISAAVAEVPTLGVLWASGAAEPLLRSTGLDMVSGTTVHIILVLVAGVVYGQLFQRAANDRNGGWLFGLAFGFLGWMAGPVTALEWIMGRPVIAGAPAQGLFAAYLLWGLCLGLLFPHVHRRLQADLDDITPRGRLSLQHKPGRAGPRR
jgi:hypothetical protein